MQTPVKNNCKYVITWTEKYMILYFIIIIRENGKKLLHFTKGIHLAAHAQLT